MSKDCSSHGGQCHRHKFLRSLFAWIITLILLILFIILIIFLVLRPTHPRFYLQDASVLTFNLSSDSNELSSTLQVTISSRNPNDRIGVFYDKLDAYAVYKNQQITLATSIPPLYQGHNDVDVWSPYLSGVDVPIAPYLGMALRQDEGAGFLTLYVRLDGRVRWKVGSWTSGHYHIDVSCPAFLSFEGGRGSGSGYNPTIRFQQLSSCNVDI